VIEFYFDFSSPYSYLSATRIEEIGARRGVPIVWMPILLGPIFKEIGKVPLPSRPRESDYARADLRRWAEWLDVPLTYPPRFPFSSLAAARGCFFAEAANRSGAYCRRLFDAAWGEGRDLEDLRVLESLAGSVGLDPVAFRESLARPEVKARLRDRNDEAFRRGLFGAPTFFVGDQMFHGNDRLFMVEEAAARLSGVEAAGTAFNRWFGIRCVSRGGGSAQYELVITPTLVNRRGVAHGGAVSSLLDTALGAAVVSGIAPEEWCATLELSIQFREAVRPGRVVGRGRMTKRGRHAAFAEGSIVDANGIELAVAHGTWYIWPRRPA